MDFLELLKYFRISITEDEDTEDSFWDEKSKSPLSESYIRQHADKLNWDQISIYQTLSESFMREFKSELDWFFISRYQKLSESFIREFQNRVSWSGISEFQKLSEPFIIEFQNKVNWSKILKHQKDLSYKFKLTFAKIHNVWVS